MATIEISVSFGDLSAYLVDYTAQIKTETTRNFDVYLTTKSELGIFHSFSKMNIFSLGIQIRWHTGRGHTVGWGQGSRLICYDGLTRRVI